MEAKHSSRVIRPAPARGERRRFVSIAEPSLLRAARQRTRSAVSTGRRRVAPYPPRATPQRRREDLRQVFRRLAVGLPESPVASGVGSCSRGQMAA